MDSEREEGEIVDEIDDLSDISSEEEYLLRQRLQVLENYNNVLERKQAKRSHSSGSRHVSNGDMLCYDLSEISATELDENVIKSPIKHHINFTIVKTNYPKGKKRKCKENEHKYKVPSKRRGKVRLGRKCDPKIISESSEESDYENVTNRRKLAEAVTIQKNGDKLDTTSLKSRLMNMLLNRNQHSESKTDNDTEKSVVKNNNTSDVEIGKDVNINCECEKFIDEDDKKCRDNINIEVEYSEKDTCNQEAMQRNKSDSEEDLEILRQDALKSKSTKTELDCNQPALILHSEDEDSDTKELRLICLKSAVLKKAFELKRKQKLQKRLSQSSNLDNQLSSDEFPDKIASDNNTDIESVDMDTGISDRSDVGENDKDNIFDDDKLINRHTELNSPSLIESQQESHNVKLILKEDEIEEDEDLLRAKLLTSLSNNLPKLIKSNNSLQTSAIQSISLEKKNKVNTEITEEKRFIINTKDSDSGSDHEATKNLTKMHNKLSPLDFQQRLDIFLKSTRMEVEKKDSSVDVENPPSEIIVQKPLEKFVPKALNHLPKSEQIEYKTLVKRIAELEKIKKARQLSMNLSNIISGNIKDTLKPRNVTIDRQTVAQSQNLDEHITLSRKKIAEESSKVLKLKEEGLKLSQKYKIVATELRNLSTAISLNKRQVRLSQIKLSKIRAQHQLLLKRSSNSIHSKHNVSMALMKPNNKITSISDIQKENVEGTFKNVQIFKSLKVSVVNNLKEKKIAPEQRLSVQIDLTNNKKTVKIPKDNVESSEVEAKKKSNDNVVNEKHKLPQDREIVYAKDEEKRKTNIFDDKVVNNTEHGITTIAIRNENFNEKGNITSMYGKRRSVDDYKSPLEAMLPAPWSEDPHGVLCPFEVAGHCKDTNCKYLHPKPCIV